MGYSSYTTVWIVVALTRGSPAISSLSAYSSTAVQCFRATTLSVHQRMPNDEPIRLVPYDPSWPSRFETEKDALRGLIGEWCVTSVASRCQLSSSLSGRQADGSSVEQQRGMS